MRTFLTLLVALLLVTPATRAQIAPPDVIVGGKSLGEWNAEFFKWLLPIHTNQSPSRDTTGMFAHVGQPDGPVFFITKGPNFEGLPHRTFEVEEGKYLYLGLTTTYVDTINDVPPRTAEELMDIAAQLITFIDDLHLEIDGVPVPNLFSYRAKSPAFSIEITEPGSNYERSYGQPFTGLLDPMVADGYAVLVTPLPPGVHVIRWGGHVGPPLDRGSDATVSITVVPIPPARRIQEIIDTVAGSDLPRGHQGSLIKTLSVARESFEAGDSQAGVSQLRAFQHKVRTHLTKENAALAKTLLQLAQQVIDRATAAVAQPTVLPNDAIVEGRTLGEWTTEWWKWILSLPTNQNPGLDINGSRASNGQPGGGVFFLANIAGQGGAVSRTFTVPEGSRLFFPARFVSLDNVDFPSPLSPEELRDAAATVVDLMTNLYTVIDGKAFDVSAHRVRSPVFSFEFASADNLDSFVYGHPVIGLVDPIVSDGYWLMVEPLPVGSHTIRFGGQIGPPFNSSKDITAFITVVAMPPARRVQELIDAVAGAGLPRGHRGSLIKTLELAKASFEADDPQKGISQLRAFQIKVRSHVTKRDAAFAEQLLELAQQIIDQATAALTQPHVLPNDAVVDGKTIGDWLAEWWKWILPIPTNRSPAFDPDGRFAHVGQPDGSVFFMVKGYNFTFVPHRSFEVPEGKYLFIPLLTVYQTTLDIDPPLSVPELQDIAAAQAMLIEELHLEIDGVPVPNLFSYRAKTPAFSIDFTEPDNLFAWGQGHPFPRPTDPVPALLDPLVADGYAVLVAPLTPGVHVIRVGGHVGSPIDRGTSGTSTVTVVSIPLTQLVEGLIVELEGAGLPDKRLRPLLEPLRKAHDSFESGHLQAGIIRLRVFQHKLRLLAQSDSVLAKQLTQAAQKIIDKAAAQWKRPREEKKAWNEGQGKGLK